MCQWPVVPPPDRRLGFILSKAAFQCGGPAGANIPRLSEDRALVRPRTVIITRRRPSSSFHPWNGGHRRPRVSPACVQL